MQRPFEAGSPRSASTGPLSGSNQAARALKGWRLTAFDFPTFRLSLLGKIMDRITVRRLGDECALSFAAWRVLSRVAISDGLTVGDVANQAWVDRAEVSRAAKILEDRGLTSRRANPDDARTPVLFCTPAGKALFEKQSALRAGYHQYLLQDFSQEELESLDKALLKIAHRVIELADG